MSEKNAFDKYLDAVRAVSEVMADHGCQLSGVNIASARAVDGVVTGDAKISLDIYIPLPTKNLDGESGSLLKA